MQFVYTRLKVLCIFVLIGGIVTSSSSSETATATSTITVPQTLSNYTYELQAEWQYTWEDCDPDVNPMQSPITINTQDMDQECPASEQLEVWFEDASFSYKLEESSLSISYEYSILNMRDTQSSLETDVYQSSSIHFHNRGEHIVDGIQGDLEVHINYKLIEGDSKYSTLVLAVPVSIIPVEQGTQGNLQTNQQQNSNLITSEQKQLPVTSTSDDQNPNQMLSQLDLFDRDQTHQINADVLFAILNTAGFYKYVGSLTTPPCMGNVVWLVSDKSAVISPSDLIVWRLLINNGMPNNREVTGSQPNITYFPNKCLQNIASFSKSSHDFRSSGLLLLLLIMICFILV